MSEPTHSIGDRLRAARQTRGLTQEQLADRAGLSIGVVKKIERGGTARLETYHALARALRVRTSTLFESGGPRPNPHADDDKVDLLALRQAISPPVTLTGRLALDDTGQDPNLDQLRTAARGVALTYHRGEYPRLVAVLPDLIRSAHTALTHFDTGPMRVEALTLRSEVLQMAGRYLTQVRAYDLAHMALTGAVSDAAGAGDRLNAASGIIGQAWVLLRQGRLDEAEQVATATATELEPRRISRASREELAAWGWLLLRGSAAAARNNRADVAAELARLARTAGTAVGEEVVDHLRGWGTFGPLTVDLKAIEAKMVAGKPDQVLTMSGRLPAGVGRATSDNWNRHMLDVARAQVMLRNSEDATRILVGLHARAPQWLRHQRAAADTFTEIRRLRKRSLTHDQRVLAGFFHGD